MMSNFRQSQLRGRDRLRGLKQAHEEVEGEMIAQRPRFERLADPGTAPQVFSSFNLFPTPPDVADQVIELARITEGMSVLEPSAGMGALAIPARESGGVVQCVEIDCQMAAYLTGLGFETANANFFRWLGGSFDRVVMNPPFKNGVDRNHIRRAMDFLKIGGRLVSVCANGPKQREALIPLATRWVELPPGSFKSEGTNVNTAIFVYDRS